MSVTGDQVISEALLLLGVIYPGQTVSAEAKATALLGINFILGEWNATGQAVYAVQKLGPYNLSNGTADYAIGAGQTFNVARPVRIETWAVTTAGGTSDDGVPLDPAAFERVAEDRTLTGTRVRALMYEATFPYGAIHVYPIPNGGQTLTLWAWVQIAEITDTTAAISLPAGYLKALVYCLAADIANKFGRQCPPDTKMIADQSRAALGATNLTQHVQTAPPAQTQV